MLKRDDREDDIEELDEEDIPTLKLCPYCLKPCDLDEGADFPCCPHCGTDVSMRPLVTMDKEIFEALPRTSCLYCGEPMLEAAEVCASCSALVPEPAGAR